MILLFTLLIGLSVASSALVYQRIAGIGDSVDQQARGIAGQMVAIDEQSELIDQQGRWASCPNALRSPSNIWVRCSIGIFTPL